MPRRLKAARLSVDGLSQKGLGVMAGMDAFVASARINQYEQGVHTPNYQTVSLLAKALNVPTAYFYAEQEDLAEVILGYSVLSKRKRAATHAYIFRTSSKNK